LGEWWFHSSEQFVDQLDAHALLDLGKHFLAAVAIITIGLEVVNRSRVIVELLTLVVRRYKGELAGLGKAVGGLGQELTHWNVTDGPPHDTTHRLAPPVTDRNWGTLQRATKRLCRIGRAHWRRRLRRTSNSVSPAPEAPEHFR
jgi:hypothetical protein